MRGLKKLNLPDADPSGAKEMAQAAIAAIGEANLEYAILCGAEIWLVRPLVPLEVLAI